MSDQDKEKSPDDDVSDRNEDLATLEALTAAGFDGDVYDRFALNMIRVSLPLLEGLILNGEAFRKLTLWGRGKQRSWWEKAVLQRDSHCASELASDSVLHALTRFQEAAWDGKGWGGWNPLGGTSMLTWFVNAAILDLANVYAKWARNLPPPQPSIEQYQSRMADRPAAGRDSLKDSPLLSSLDPHEQEMLIDQYERRLTHQEIAEARDITPKASQGRAARIIKKLRNNLGGESH